MKLRILGNFETTNKAPLLPFVSSTDDIQFPNISTTGSEMEDNLSIGHAGSQSLMRARFKYSTLDGNQSQVPATETETQSDTASQHATLQVNSVPNGAPSPTFFYTSSYVDATGNIHPHGTYPSTVDGLELVAQDATPLEAGTAQQLPELQERQWDDQAIYHHVDNNANNVISPCYNPDGSCLYCPSRGYHTQHGVYAGTHTPQGTGSLAHFGLSPAPTPPISMYYPHPPPPLTVSPSASGMISAAPHAGGLGMGVLSGGYEYLDQQMHLASVNAQTPAAPWVSPAPFDLAMSAGLAPTPTGMIPIPMNMGMGAAMNVNMNVGINMNMTGGSLGIPTPHAYFMRGDEAVGVPSSGRMYHHHHHHHGYLRPDAMQRPHAMTEGSSPLTTCIPSMRGSRRGSATGVVGAGSTPRSSPPSGRRSASRLQRPKDLDNNNNTPKASPPPQIPTSPSLGTSLLNDRNQLNIARIEEGLDTRTTVMIKNIPNKMSDRDLMTYIDRVCPRRIDFFYLRMDFQNGGFALHFFFLEAENMFDWVLRHI